MHDTNDEYGHTMYSLHNAYISHGIQTEVCYIRIHDFVRMAPKLNNISNVQNWNEWVKTKSEIVKRSIKSESILVEGVKAFEYSD